MKSIDVLVIGPWQTSRASAIIDGVGRDAEMIMHEILRNLK